MSRGGVVDYANAGFVTDQEAEDMSKSEESASDKRTLPTPRYDALAAKDYPHLSDWMDALIEHARQLERDLVEACRASEGLWQDGMRATNKRFAEGLATASHELPIDREAIERAIADVDARMEEYGGREANAEEMRVMHAVIERNRARNRALDILGTLLARSATRRSE